MRPWLTAVLIAVLAASCTIALSADRVAMLQLGPAGGGTDGPLKGWSPCAGFEHNIPGLPTGAEMMTGVEPDETVADFEPTDTYQGFTITKEIDAAASLLFRACVEGKQIPELQFALFSRVGGEVTREALFTLEDARIASITILGPGEGDRPEGVAADKPVVVITVMAVVVGNNFEEVKVT